MKQRKYCKSFPALRVSQLDASDLDDSINEILTTRLKSIFSYCNPTWSLNLNPEIELFLKCILWKYTVNKHGYSLGQQMMNMQYMENTDFNIISKKKRIFYGLINTIFVWFYKRRNSLQSSLMKLADRTLSWVSHIEILFNLMNLLNFLMFIFHGHYLNLVERFLGIRSRFLKPQSFRRIDFDYMNRELIWQGISESISIIVSSININRIKNTFNRLWINNKDDANKIECRSQSDYKTCVLCYEWPTSPHEIGCRHVFCYICIKGNYMLDEDISCPVCGIKPLSENDITPVFLL